jgi:hypothetical protein
MSTGTIGRVAFKAPSQSRSGSRSPASASSMIFCATAARRLDERDLASGEKP